MKQTHRFCDACQKLHAIKLFINPKTGRLHRICWRERKKLDVRRAREFKEHWLSELSPLERIIDVAMKAGMFRYVALHTEAKNKKDKFPSAMWHRYFEKVEELRQLAFPEQINRLFRPKE